MLNSPPPKKAKFPTDAAARSLRPTLSLDDDQYPKTWALVDGEGDGFIDGNEGYDEFVDGIEGYGVDGVPATAHELVSLTSFFWKRSTIAPSCTTLPASLSLADTHTT